MIILTGNMPPALTPIPRQPPTLTPGSTLDMTEPSGSRGSFDFRGMEYMEGHEERESSRAPSKRYTLQRHSQRNVKRKV